MAQMRKLEAEVVIASSGDLFFESLATTPHELVNFYPELYRGCELLEGQFGKPGFVVRWTYTLEGKTYVMKERFETLDKENGIMKLVALEGDVMDVFKRFELTVQVSTKAKGTNVVKWTLEYEKVHEGVPDPYHNLEAAIQTTKKIDMHLSCVND